MSEKIVPGAKPGHVMLWTTPLSRRPDANSPDAWNEFPMPTVGWSFFYLMNQTVPYLAGVAGERLNYDAGEDVTLRVDPGKRFNHYAIQAPESKASDDLGEPVGGALVISAAPQVGQWDVTATGPGGLNKKMGFSVNVPRQEMQFAPIDAEGARRPLRQGQVRSRRQPRDAQAGRSTRAASAARRSRS